MPTVEISAYLRNSSLYGATKMVSSDRTVSKIIWLLFMIFMMISLSISIFLSVKNYLEYATYLQSSLQQKYLVPFPDVTVCNQNPFSINAEALWTSGKIDSPRHFREQLDNMFRQALRNNQSNLLSSIVYLNNLESYYKSLSAEDVANVSHSPTSFLQGCIVHGIDNSFYLKFNYDCPVIIRTLNHPRYFNCLVFKMKDFENTTLKSHVREIQLIFNQKALNHSSWSHVFMTDALDHYHGLRVTLHEPDSFPDMMTHGVGVSVNQRADISFRPILWNKAQIPGQHCLSNLSERQIHDFDQVYQYSSTSCAQQAFNHMSYKTCRCLLYAEYPRGQVPLEDRNRYCSQVMTNLTELSTRIDCITNYLANRLNSAVNSAAEDNQCIPRCSYFTYEANLFSTHWSPRGSEISWFVQAINEMFKYLENNEQNLTVQAFADAYLRTNHNDSTSSERLNHTDGFSMIRILRATEDLEIRAEKLQLSLNGLLSQIGGLCGLYLGMSFAFFLEIFECLFLIISSQIKEAYRNSFRISRLTTHNETVMMCASASANLSVCYKPPNNHYKHDEETNSE